MNLFKTQISFLFLCCFLSTGLTAQAEVIIANIAGPSGMTIIGNDVYYSEYDGFVISKFDPSQSLITPELSISNVFGPYGHSAQDNHFYVAANQTGQLLRYKLDSLDSEPDVLLGALSGPTDLLEIGDFLYFTVGELIFKLDLTDPDAEAQPAIGGFMRATGLELKDNILYIADFNAGAIFKADLNQAFPAIGVISDGLNSPNHLYLDGDNLYFSQFGDMEDGKISMINISADNAIVEDLITNLLNPTGLVVIDDILYFGEYTAGTISKYNLNTTSIDDNLSNKELKILPNPTQDFVTIENLQANTAISIYNVAGVKVEEYLTPSNNKINVQHLETGIYFLIVENETPIKFSKF